MKLRTTSEYALRVLVHMSQHEEDIHTAKNLAEVLDIPYKYLTRIMTTLAKEGLFQSTRGRYGGFTFAKPLDQITVYEILASFNDINDDVCIMGKGTCDQSGSCALHDSWKKPKELIDEMFKNSTLADLKKTGKEA